MTMKKHHGCDGRMCIALAKFRCCLRRKGDAAYPQRGVSTGAPRLARGHAGGIALNDCSPQTSPSLPFITTSPPPGSHILTHPPSPTTPLDGPLLRCTLAIRPRLLYSRLVLDHFVLVRLFLPYQAADLRASCPPRHHHNSLTACWFPFLHSFAHPLIPLPICFNIPVLYTLFTRLLSVAPTATSTCSLTSTRHLDAHDPHIDI